MSIPKILYVSHKEKNCGVHDFGLNVWDAIHKSVKYNFIYCECDNATELNAYFEKHKPAAAVYNYHPSTLKWLTRRLIRKYDIPQIGTIHEITQEIADKADNSFFDFFLAADPTLLLRNPLVFKTGRPLPEYKGQKEEPDKLTFGSFGFGTAGKGFDRVIKYVQDEFDEAIIRFNIPYATFGDKNGTRARQIAHYCKSLISKPKIEFQLTHDFLDKEELLNFLAGNTLNLFLYDQMKNRGISSAIDYALASGRPFAVSDSIMFRHVFSPEISIGNNALHSLIQNGTKPLEKFTHQWSAKNLVWDYERIIDNALKNYTAHGTYLKTKIHSLVKKIRKSGSFAYLEDKTMGLDLSIIQRNNTEPSRFIYHPVPGQANYNCILNKQMREKYKPAIDFLFLAEPEIMKRKIPEANVQQAFVLDTVYKLAGEFEKPAILCVGSYEDTAAGSLKKIGFELEEIDPVLNYSLDLFMTKPSTLKQNYDVIFSTSVIEHVKDDELFVSQMAELVKPGGYIVQTCDFNNHYKPGDKIPQVDFRFYTKFDLENRLLGKMKDCELFGTANWDGEPDFTFENCTYSFAGFTVKKRHHQ